MKKLVHVGLMMILTCMASAWEEGTDLDAVHRMLAEEGGHTNVIALVQSFESRYSRRNATVWLFEHDYVEAAVGSSSYAAVHRNWVGGQLRASGNVAGIVAWNPKIAGKERVKSVQWLTVNGHRAEATQLVPSLHNSAVIRGAVYALLPLAGESELALLELPAINALLAEPSLLTWGLHVQADSIRINEKLSVSHPAWTATTVRFLLDGRIGRSMRDINARKEALKELAVIEARRIIRERGDSFVTVDGVNPVEAEIEDVVTALNAPHLSGLESALSALGISTEPQSRSGLAPLFEYADRVMIGEIVVPGTAQGSLLILMGVDVYNEWVRVFNEGGDVPVIPALPEE